MVRSRSRVRLRRLLLVRVQGGLPPPVRGVLEPGQDAVLERRRRRPRDRPPRGLLLLGHGGPAADRRAPQRRHVQPRPPQSRADRGARARRWSTSTSATTTSRRSPAPRSPRRWSRPAPTNLQARRLRVRRRRGHRHRDQDRAPRHASAARSSRSSRATTATPGSRSPTGDDRFSTLFLSDRPDEFVQVPFNDLDAMEEALRGQATSPRVMMETIPATYGFPLPEPGYLARGQARCASATARSTSPTRCRPA